MSRSAHSSTFFSACIIAAQPSPPFFFFFNARPPPETSTLSLHDALPTFSGSSGCWIPTRHESSGTARPEDRKSTRLNSSHVAISYAVFCLKTKRIHPHTAVLRAELANNPRTPLDVDSCGAKHPVTSLLQV